MHARWGTIARQLGIAYSDRRDMLGNPSSEAQADAEGAGYRISFDGDNDHVYIKGWGFWDESLAVAFASESLAACRARTRLLRVGFDAVALKPQAESGQAALRSLMSHLSSRKLSDCQVISDNILTLMQLRRLARECSLKLTYVGERWA